MNDRTDRPVRRLDDDGYVTERPAAAPRMRRADPRELADHEQDAYEPQAPRSASSPAAVAAAQGKPAPQRDEEDENVVVFSKAYQAHGEDVRRIRLRRPVTKDIKVCGTPIRPHIGDDGRIVDIEIKWDVVARYIPLLSDPPLPPSTVDKMEFFDLDACAGVLARFFVRTA